MGISSSTPVPGIIEEIKEWSWYRVEQVLDTYEAQGYSFALDAQDVSSLLNVDRSKGADLVQLFTAGKNERLNAMVLLAGLTIVANSNGHLDTMRYNKVFDLFDFNKCGRLDMDEVSIAMLCCGTAMAAVLKQPMSNMEDPILEGVTRNIYKYLSKDEDISVEKMEFEEWALNTVSNQQLEEIFATMVVKVPGGGENKAGEPEQVAYRSERETTLKPLVDEEPEPEPVVEPEAQFADVEPTPEPESDAAATEEPAGEGEGEEGGPVEEPAGKGEPVEEEPASEGEGGEGGPVEEPAGEGGAIEIAADDAEGMQDVTAELSDAKGDEMFPAAEEGEKAAEPEPDAGAEVAAPAAYEGGAEETMEPITPAMADLAPEPMGDGERPVTAGGDIEESYGEGSFEQFENSAPEAAATDEEKEEKDKAADAAAPAP